MRIINFKANDNDIGMSNHCVDVDAFEEEGKIYITVNNNHAVQYIKDQLDQDYLNKTDIQNNIINILKEAMDKLLSKKDHSASSGIHGEGTVEKYGHVYRPITPAYFQKIIGVKEERVKKIEKEEIKKKIEEKVKEGEEIDWEEVRKDILSLINAIENNLKDYDSQKIITEGEKIIEEYQKLLTAIDNKTATEEMLDHVNENMIVFNIMLQEEDNDDDAFDAQRAEPAVREGDMAVSSDVLSKIMNALSTIKKAYITARSLITDPDPEEQAELTPEEKKEQEKTLKSIDEVLEKIAATEIAFEERNKAKNEGDEKREKALTKLITQEFQKISDLDDLLTNDLSILFEQSGKDTVNTDDIEIKEEIKKVNEEARKAKDKSRTQKLTSVVLTPSSWNQKTKARNKAWEENDDDKWACYAIATESGTRNQPSAITFSNFRPKIPAEAKIKKITLKYSDAILKKRRFGWIKIGAPKVSINPKGSVSVDGPTRWEGKGEPFGTHSESISGNWSPSEINKLKITISYPRNTTAAIGTLALRYVRVEVKYEL